MESASLSVNDSVLFEVIKAINAKDEAEPCAICRLAARSATRAVREIFSEFVNDPQARDKFRATGGFCQLHTSLVEATGDALGVAILYSDLTRLVIESLEPTKPRSLLRSSKPKPCLCCATENEASARYLKALADAANVTELELGGFCRLHHQSLCKLLPPAIREKLIAQEVTHLKRLQTELDEIIRKNDYRFRHEEWGDERDAWRRALAKLRRIG